MISKMRDIVEVWKATATTDRHGGQTNTWAKDREVWAAVANDAGSFGLESQRPTNNYAIRVTLPFEAAYEIAETDRLKYRGNFYNIRAKVADSRTWVTITATATDNANEEIYLHL